MKKLFATVALSFISLTYAQDCNKEASLEAQKKLNEEYANPKTSPLAKKDRKAFKSLAFYPVDLKYCVTATLARTTNEKPFAMATTDGQTRQYVKYGELRFTVEGKACKLDVYQSPDLIKREEYKDYLFLPFTDDTNGEGSYAGGRYIDLRIPQGTTIQIDFNKAYNPYCAYNHSYSCPIPPTGNYLQLKIEAGVKAYNK